MKATFEFDMTDPDDVRAHFRVTKSLDMALLLHGFFNNIKKSYEFNIESGKYKDQYELLEDIYETMWNEMNNRKLYLDDLIN